MRPLLLPALLLAALPAFGTDVLPPLFGHRGVQQSVTTEPPLRTSTTAARVLVKTSGATENDLAELRRANANSDGPLHVGIVKELEPVSIVSAQSGRWQWRGAVQAEGARRVRVRLDDVVLPAGAKLWIYGTGGAAIAITANTGTLWTPSVAGDTATIEVDAPGSASFRIGALADMRHPSDAAAHDTSCIEDATCHNGNSALGRAIAFYDFVAGTRLLSCTGGLVNNAAQDGAPYFLTANHCVKTAEQAATLEAFWDYRSSACNAHVPPFDTFPRTLGATLLVTSFTSDVTLLRLHGIPPNRTFLGWDRRDLAHDTPLFHLSHPNGAAQRYSSSALDEHFAGCASSQRPSFLYSRPLVGATDVGSSGAPLLYGEGYVVGQLKSGCGPEPDNACNRANRDVDGAFAVSYAQLRPFLDPAPQCETCTPNDTTACLLGNRFKVTVTWNDTFAGISGMGHPIRYSENTPDPIVENAFFSFYGHAPKAVETIVKIVKGVTVNDKYWLFVAGFSGAAYDVTVQDTTTCAKWERSVPSQSPAIIRDYEAFPLP
ncbi:MAG TPA: trypsin-like peptidase domain-containing protein [Thermoanaerobaculia bacterium]|nr:trypsin-like peptidase domain-containing protein [Thermoanaerobaculia bacterium]